MVVQCTNAAQVHYLASGAFSWLLLLRDGLLDAAARGRAVLRHGPAPPAPHPPPRPPLPRLPGWVLGSGDLGICSTVALRNLAAEVPGLLFRPGWLWEDCVAFTCYSYIDI